MTRQPKIVIRMVAVNVAEASIPALDIINGFTTMMYDMDRKISRAPLNSVLTSVERSVRWKNLSRHAARPTVER